MALVVFKYHTCPESAVSHHRDTVFFYHYAGLTVIELGNRFIVIYHYRIAVNPNLAGGGDFAEIVIVVASLKMAVSDCNKTFFHSVLQRIADKPVDKLGVFDSARGKKLGIHAD